MAVSVSSGPPSESEPRSLGYRPVRKPQYSSSLRMLNWPNRSRSSTLTTSTSTWARCSFSSNSGQSCGVVSALCTWPSTELFIASGTTPSREAAVRKSCSVGFWKTEPIGSALDRPPITVARKSFGLGCVPRFTSRIPVSRSRSTAKARLRSASGTCPTSWGSPLASTSYFTLPRAVNITWHLVVIKAL